jgi:ABC-type dipeptide/oligopeptide/nickel transport system permease subunit
LASFLILALSVLAFFGNSLPLLIGLMGLFGWERYARIVRGLLGDWLRDRLDPTLR